MDVEEIVNESFSAHADIRNIPSKVVISCFGSIKKLMYIICIVLGKSNPCNFDCFAVVVKIGGKGVGSLTRVC